MNAYTPQQLLKEVFLVLRRSGFSLGINELLLAFKAVNDGWGENDLEELKKIIQLLWCSSLAQISEFEIIWKAVIDSPSPTRQNVSSRPDLVEKEAGSEPLPEPFTPPSDDSHSPIMIRRLAPDSPDLSLRTLPIQAPFNPIFLDLVPELHSYWPVSQRDMVYAWRYLRRPVADGPADILDLPATIEQTAQQGFFISPVFKRRKQNHAHLILLLDQGGSMMPFHRFTRDLVATAQYESGIQQVNAFYFYNVPTDEVSLDSHLTEKIDSEKLLTYCDSETSLLIVSDAGAARGYSRRERIKSTTRFLSRLKKHTKLIAWLNPLPEERWSGSSAQIISHLVPMYQMDPDGLSNAIDVIRGQSL